MNHSPLLTVVSWNNVMRCPSRCIPITAYMFEVLSPLADCLFEWFYMTSSIHTMMRLTRSGTATVFLVVMTYRNLSVDQYNSCGGVSAMCTWSRCILHHNFIMSYHLVHFIGLKKSNTVECDHISQSFILPGKNNGTYLNLTVFALIKYPGERFMLVLNPMEWFFWYPIRKFDIYLIEYKMHKFEKSWR